MPWESAKRSSREQRCGQKVDLFDHVYSIMYLKGAITSDGVSQKFKLLSSRRKFSKRLRNSNVPLKRRQRTSSP